MVVGQIGQRGNHVKVILMYVNVGQGHVADRRHSLVAGRVLVLAFKLKTAPQVRLSDDVVSCAIKYNKCCHK